MNYEESLTRLILHNSMSLDGSLIGFNVNMNLHYQIAGTYKPHAHLIGSNTILSGIELYGTEPVEEENDYRKPTRGATLPYWVIIDTKGVLQGRLHEIRRFEFCKDVVILVSEITPENYITYLAERDYDVHIVGKEHINLKDAVKLLSNQYNIETILTDCGKVLGNLLLNQGLIDEISLLVHPIIVGVKSYNIFNNVSDNIQLKLLRNETISENFIWLVFKVMKT